MTDRAPPPRLTARTTRKRAQDPRLDPHDLGPSGRGCVLGLVVTVVGAAVGVLLWWGLR